MTLLGCWFWKTATLPTPMVNGSCLIGTRGSSNGSCSPNANGGSAAGLAMSRVTGVFSTGDHCVTLAEEIACAINLGYTGWSDYSGTQSQ